jgi:hypothetical protein
MTFLTISNYITSGKKQTKFFYLFENEVLKVIPWIGYKHSELGFIYTIDTFVQANLHAFFASFTDILSQIPQKNHILFFDASINVSKAILENFNVKFEINGFYNKPRVSNEISGDIGFNVNFISGARLNVLFEYVN